MIETIRYLAAVGVGISIFTLVGCSPSNPVEVLDGTTFLSARNEKDGSAQRLSVQWRNVGKQNVVEVWAILGAREMSISKNMSYLHYRESSNYPVQIFRSDDNHPSIMPGETYTTPYSESFPLKKQYSQTPAEWKEAHTIAFNAVIGYPDVEITWVKCNGPTPDCFGKPTN